MLKIVCVMATHRRAEITTKTLERLKRQTYSLNNIVLVGDSSVEENVAKKTGCIYVFHENEPLSDKWQAGVYAAKQLNPDAIMICGSDSWLTNNWTEYCIKYLENGSDLIGTTVFHTCRAFPNEQLKIVQRQYCGRRQYEPVGSGRIISSKILSKFDWNLFPKNKNAGLDNPCFHKILEHQGVVTIIQNEIKVMGIKSNWVTINPWKHKLKNNSTVRVIKVINKPKKWLYANFDTALQDLQKVVPGLII